MTEEKKNDATSMEVDDEFEIHAAKDDKKTLTVNGKTPKLSAVPVSMIQLMITQ